MSTDNPWGLTEIHVDPSGLRECVLRVQYMTESEVRTCAALRKESLYHQVVRWRFYQPTKWAELISAMDLESLESERVA